MADAEMAGGNLRTQGQALTCDTFLFAEEPELIHHSQHLDDISHEEGQLLRDAGTEIKDRSYHRASLHCVGSAGRLVPNAEIQRKSVSGKKNLKLSQIFSERKIFPERKRQGH